MKKEEIKALAFDAIAVASADWFDSDPYSAGWLNGVTSIVNEIIEGIETEEVEAHIDWLMATEGDKKAEAPQPDATEEPDEPEAETSAPEEPPKRKGGKPEVKLDMPAVKAMRDAGRTWAWIADEFGCSDQTVINHYKRVYGDE